MQVDAIVRVRQPLEVIVPLDSPRVVVVRVNHMLPPVSVASFLVMKSVAAEDRRQNTIVVAHIVQKLLIPRKSSDCEFSADRKNSYEVMQMDIILPCMVTGCYLAQATNAMHYLDKVSEGAQ